MLTDIEIAQNASLLPIKEVAQKLGVNEDELEFYGKYKAKFSEEAYQRLQSQPDGKLVLVTAINPTPAGEGKTTTSVGLAQAMEKIGKKAVLALREPSLGPVFGVKGGAAGGGTFGGPAARRACGRAFPARPCRGGKEHSFPERRGDSFKSAQNGGVLRNAYIPACGPPYAGKRKSPQRIRNDA